MADKKKILVIEDEEFLRDLYVEILTDEGFSIDEASDGEEGLAKAQNGGYDLLLVDIMLPKRDGLDVLRELKKNPPKTRNGAIILLTNLGQDGVIKEGYSLGAVSYLVKSDLTPDKVVAQIKGVLKEKT